MNTAKISNYNKLIAFFLIVVALLSVLVVSANGRQDNDNPVLESGNNSATNNKNDDADESPAEIPTTTPEPETPKFYHHITGVEVAEEIYGDLQIAYVIDGNSPLCGISNCNILIEFPLENEKTRYIMIADKSASLMKIGSIAYSRRFMSNLAASFGATVISLGNDDITEYDFVDTSSYSVELLKTPGSYYTEYTYFTYTSTQLLTQSILSAPRVQSILPYGFKDSYEVSGAITATTINIPYETSTCLTYQQSENKYCLNKMGSDKIDVSTSDKALFTNVIILYADSMTYETSSKTQMVMNTIGTGKGYYAYGGMAEEITWTMNEQGNLSLFSHNGEKLKIAPGNAYISYVKSSKSNTQLFK